MRKYMCLLLLLLASTIYGCKMKDKTEYDEFDEQYNEFMTRYKSTEQKAYYHVDEDEEWDYVPYKPMDSAEVKSYKNKFFEFKEIEDFTPYDEQKEFHTPYRDSLWEVGQERVKRYMDTAADPRHVNFDIFYHEPQYIGKIDREQILKYERKDNVDAFVYLGSEFQIWIAYSTDKGKTWSYYYTGVVQERPLYVKWYSKYPLINSNGDMQIEACLMRKASDPELYGYVRYELVQDGLLLTIDLETLAKDSDGDGLTDIMETRLRTDLNNPDTDGDGITDNLDMNPRFNLPRTEKTLIYEAVLNEDPRAHHFWDEDECEIIPFSEVPAPHYVTDTTRTILIVTDDPEFLACQPTKERVVFLTEDEFESTKDKFLGERSNISFSPLFKVDNVADAYVFDVGGWFWSNDYVAEKKKDGWLIRITSSIIE